MADRTLKVTILGDASSAKRAFASIESGTSRTSRAFGAMGRVLKTGAIAAGAGLVAVGGIAIKAALEAEKVGAQTKAVLKSTGGAANVTAKQVAALSTEIMGYSGLSDEAVQTSANLLLTFKNIQNQTGKNNDVFDQATRITADLSVALGKDLNSSAMMVGKALNDPIAGLTALGRAGVQFTTQQKEQIKTLVESGKTLQAQKVIMKELETQVGGSAEAIGKTTEGKLKIAFESVGNVLEKIGAVALPIIADVGQKLAAFLGSKDFQKWASDAMEWIGNLVSTLTDILVPVFENVVIPAFKAVVEFVRAAWPKIVEIVRGVVDLIKAIWDRFGKQIVEIVRIAWDYVSGYIKAALKIIQGVISVVTGIIKGDWHQVWDGIKSIVSGVWDQIKNIVKTAVRLVKVVIDTGISAIKGIWNTFWNGLKAVVEAVVGWVVDKVQTMIGWIQSAIDKLNFLKGAVSGGPLIDKFDGTLPPGAGSVAPFMAGGGTTIVNHFNGDIYDGEKFEQRVERAIYGGTFGRAGA